MGTYKTNSRLWFARFVLTFFVIGFLVHFGTKGDEVSLVQVVGSAILAGSVRAFVVVAGWALIAAAVGWAVQCAIVLIAGWKQGGP